MNSGTICYFFQGKWNLVCYILWLSSYFFGLQLHSLKFRKMLWCPQFVSKTRIGAEPVCSNLKLVLPLRSFAFLHTWLCLWEFLPVLLKESFPWGWQTVSWSWSQTAHSWHPLRTALCTPPGSSLRFPFLLAYAHFTFLLTQLRCHTHTHRPLLSLLSTQNPLLLPAFWRHSLLFALCPFSF